jgi:hypothetical protein
MLLLGIFLGLMVNTLGVFLRLAYGAGMWGEALVLPVCMHEIRNLKKGLCDTYIA